MLKYIALYCSLLLSQDCSADCAKFQKSELEFKFSKKALERPYNSKHSWGKTYGDHNRHLEFSHGQYRDLKKFAAEINIFLTASRMDEVKVTFYCTMQITGRSGNAGLKCTPLNPTAIVDCKHGCIS